MNVVSTKEIMKEGIGLERAIIAAGYGRFS